MKGLDRVTKLQIHISQAPAKNKSSIVHAFFSTESGVQNHDFTLAFLAHRRMDGAWARWPKKPSMPFCWTPLAAEKETYDGSPRRSCCENAETCRQMFCFLA